MGPLTLPTSGLVIIDAVTLIYSVERHPVYGPVLDPFWEAAQAGDLEVAASQLIVLETLVLPFRVGDASLQSDYETALFGSDLRLLPITVPILREAARLRAAHNLRTPDAIHAATALDAGVALFLTNDADFRRVPDLPVTLIRDVLP